MVWPFSSKADSAEAFERKLSLLASQIQDHEKKLNTLRGRGRRLKALWTLYTIISYAVYAIVLVVVVGVDQASVPALGGLVGTPFVIYIVRKLIIAYYDWRTTNFENSLQTLQAQQRENIDKLKAATKFNSTQALLEKYGGSAGLVVPQSPLPRPKSPAKTLTSPKRGGGNQLSRSPSGSQRRTGSPQQQQQQQHQQQQQAPIQLPRAQAAGPVSAPQSPPQLHGDSPLRQVVLSPPQQQQEVPQRRIPPPPQPSNLPPLQAEEEKRQHQWYDRFIDVLLGEDEMSPKARYALICSNCRQVNGLAPPGLVNVDDVRYRCGRCGAENGKPEVSRIIAQVAQEGEGSVSGSEFGSASGSVRSKKGKGKRKKVVREPTPEPEESGSEEVVEEASDGESEEEVVQVVRRRKSARSVKKA